MFRKDLMEHKKNCPVCLAWRKDEKNPQCPYVLGYLKYTQENWKPMRPYLKHKSNCSQCQDLTKPHCEQGNHILTKELEDLSKEVFKR